MNERLCIRLMVEGKARQMFYQVLFVQADSVDAARDAARSYLKANAAVLVSFDEEETAEIDMSDIPEASMLRERSVEGVVGATGRVYVVPEIAH